MIIRIQSPDGVKRINIEPDGTRSDVYKETKKVLNMNKEWTLYYDRQKDRVFSKSRSKIKLKNGDMLFLLFNSGPNVTSTESDVSMTPATSSKRESVHVEEHPIDKELWSVDWAQVNINHDKGAVIKIDKLKVDPWDDQLLKEKAIKFQSFHSHMRMLTSGVDKGKFVKLEREKTSKTLEDGQKMMMSEMPSSITLNRQPYRHIDNVCFNNREIMDTFLEEWRTTAHQQVGWLFGTYSKYDEVPLGIKCSVDAIYRFPQTFSNSKLTMSDDPNEDEILKIASELGLTRVGWIITDLVPDQNGLVKEIRSADSHFLTAEEAILAGKMQNLHPNPCRLAPSGYFGSKFVTVVVTGKENGEIDFRGYQISNQGQSLAVDGTIVPTIDAPEFGYTIPSTEALYCPDVFYREKDDYGNDVTKIGRPLPIEYLLTDMGVNFSMNFNYFVSNKEKGYRPTDGAVDSIANYLKEFRQDSLFDGLKDFNVLVALGTNDTLPLKSRLNLLLDAVKKNDLLKFSNFLQSNEWLTTQTILETTIAQPGVDDPMDGADDELRMAIERSIRET